VARGLSFGSVLLARAGSIVPIPLAAQSGAGAVHDPTGAMIAGATVDVLLVSWKDLKKVM